MNLSVIKPGHDLSASLSFRMTPDLRAWVDRTAKLNGLKPSDFVRAVVEDARVRLEQGEPISAEVKGPQSAPTSVRYERLIAALTDFHQRLGEFLNTPESK